MLSTSPRTLPLILLTLSFLFPTGLIKGSAESPASTLDELAEWDAFLAETDAFLAEAEDPLSEFESLESNLVFWSTSLRAGAGHSTNFLKRTEPVSSPFLKIEGDFLLNAVLSHSNLTALLYFEGVRYDQQAGVDHETIAFIHANWTEFRAAYSYGLEVSAFYGDQIYDASLTAVSTPMGASLRQFRPEIAIFGDWDMGTSDSLKATLSLRRTLIEDENEDHWRPQVALEWNRAWSGSFGTRTEVAAYREVHDDEIARTATGLGILPEEKLEIAGIQIEEVLTWKPVQWEALSTSARFGAAREEDPDDQYDALTRLWASVSGTLDLEFAEIGINANWQNTRYEDRQVSSLDTRPVHQIYRTLQLEIEKSLRWNISLKGSVQWIEFDSRVSGDSFSERRVQALLDWTY